ncbi:MAG: DUF3842 family protein [Erysipelotrichaceae bacterium]|nr:DUF3842 family protein [Erysipelotrichaceae bacterium]
MKKIIVIDGQGGNIGKQLVTRIREELPDAYIRAVGTNSIATGNMIKAGADEAATGENAVIVAARDADIITGPVGIIVADALLGEVSSAMAKAVSDSKAIKVLIPVNKCDILIAGVKDKSISELIEAAIRQIVL